MDNSDLVLEGSVHNAMTLKRVEALELGGDDNRGKGLTAAACDNQSSMSVEFERQRRDRLEGFRGVQLTRHICDFDVGGLEALLDGLAEGFVCDLRHCFWGFRGRRY